MAKKQDEQQTMEEYLLSQLDTPVILKDGSTATKADGSPMTKQEAIATNILNLAMKGDVKAIMPECSIICQIEFANIEDPQTQLVMSGQMSINETK